LLNYVVPVPFFPQCRSKFKRANLQIYRRIIIVIIVIIIIIIII